MPWELPIGRIIVLIGFIAITMLYQCSLDVKPLYYSQYIAASLNRWAKNEHCHHARLAYLPAGHALRASIQGLAKGDGLSSRSSINGWAEYRPIRPTATA